MTGRNLCAIIPAKKHSCRAPYKNVRNLSGLALCMHSVFFCIGHDIPFVVSTDDEMLMAQCRKHGWEYCREQVDDADMVNCLLQAMEGREEEYCLLLQPTSPLRHIAVLQEMLRLVDGGILDVVYTASRIKMVGWLEQQGEKGREFILQRRAQDATRHLMQFDGNMVLMRRSLLQKYGAIFPSPDKARIGYVLQGGSASLQVDSETDYELMQAIYDAEYPHHSPGGQ